MWNSILLIEKIDILCYVLFWYAIVETFPKNRTGYGQADVVLGLGQCTIAMNIEETTCSKNSKCWKGSR